MSERKRTRKEEPVKIKRRKKKPTLDSITEKEYILTPEAVDLVEQTTGYRPTINTIRNWCKNQGIGKQIGSKWLVNVKKLQEVIENAKV